ncbi:MAG: thiolase family protein, partial [Bacillota bacterium]|nr:thiolase family protein [Bacillota bacterium]
VAYGRSAIGRAIKGSLRNTHPVDYAGQVLKKVVNKVPELDLKDIGDIIIGCSKSEEVQGYNIANLMKFRAELPDSIPAQTVNRFCSSGLQAIHTAANLIRTGDMEVVIAGGVESMSMLPMGTKESVRNKWLMENKKEAYMSMGLTAENVAEKYNITRKEMDELAIVSHKKASYAIKEGRFKDQIVPIKALDDNGEWFDFYKDEGVREGNTLEKLSKLKTVFKEDGKVTAATSSQMSDGASIMILMSRKKSEKLGLKPLARFLGGRVAALDPAYMGLGPIKAVPKLLNSVGLKIEDMDVIELNEAFASQAIPCMDVLNMDRNKVNINGGAMALGHPLGATGAVLTCKALAELERTSKRYALITMCVGGGMGYAAIFERLE